MITVVRARFYPASVVLPNGGGTLRKVYALLAEDGPEAGLWLYQQPGQHVYHAPIDWARTTVPTTGKARHGFDVHLTDGTVVVITAGQSCRCGALGRWAGPAWANRVEVRT